VPAGPGELGGDASVRAGVTTQLGQSEAKSVVAFVDTAVPSMSDRKVRHDPSLLLRIAQLSYGCGSLLEQRGRAAVVAGMAQRERKVVLDERRRVGIMCVAQDFERSRVQGNCLGRRTVASPFCPGGVETKSLALEIDGACARGGWADRLLRLRCGRGDSTPGGVAEAGQLRDGSGEDLAATGMQVADCSRDRPHQRVSEVL